MPVGRLKDSFHSARDGAFPINVIFSAFGDDVLQQLWRLAREAMVICRRAILSVSPLKKVPHALPKRADTLATSARNQKMSELQELPSWVPDWVPGRIPIADRVRITTRTAW